MTQLQTVSNKPMTIAGMLTNKSFKDQISLALPKHMTSDRLARIALTEVKKNPKLLACGLESFASSILTASQLGLEIGAAFGQGYLIPYGKDCQLIIGYRGMIQLAHRSGQIKNIHADVVYEDDLFEYEYGINMVFKHRPAKNKGKKDITHIYAYAHLANDGFDFVVLEKEDVDKIKASSRSRNIWNEYYVEMAKKTALRRLFKTLPVSAEIVQAMIIEDARENDASTEFVNNEMVNVSDTMSNALVEEIAQKNEVLTRNHALHGEQDNAAIP